MPKPTFISRIAVLGGGISACAFFREYILLGGDASKLRLFEKSRGLGGRSSTRWHPAWGRWNLGAPFFTIRDQYFKETLEKDSFSFEVLKDPVFNYKASGVEPATAVARHRMVGGMNQLPKALLGQDIPIEVNQRVTKLLLNDPKGANSAIFLEIEGQDHAVGPFDLVVITYPAPQAIELLESSLLSVPDILQRAFEPCWAYAFVTKPITQPIVSHAFVEGHNLSWFSKVEPWEQLHQPGGQNQYWVLHSSKDFAKNMDPRSIEDDASLQRKVDDALFIEWCDLQQFADRPERIFSFRHYWRYAKAVDPASCGSFLWDENKLGFCGDYLAGSRVEGAFMSGVDLARKIVGHRPSR